MDMVEIVILTSLVVILPIIPAFVLFKFLPSTGDVTGPFKGMKIKLSGSFAGYFIIVLIVLGLISQLDRGQEYEFWQVGGSVQLDRPGDTSGIMIRLLPPNPQITPDGYFIIENVPVSKRTDGRKPTLIIEKSGYETATIHLDEKKTSVARKNYGIKYENQQISIANPIELKKAKPYDPSTGVDARPLN